MEIAYDDIDDLLEAVSQRLISTAYAGLLRERDKPVVVVALESGFSDISHFNRLFKKRFDASPTAIRSRR
jgi:AraC-like DNA-binding protein